MKIFGKKIMPISHINVLFMKMDVRWFFVWLEDIERTIYLQRKNIKLRIDSAKSKVGTKWLK